MSRSTVAAALAGVLLTCAVPAAFADDDDDWKYRRRGGWGWGRDRDYGRDRGIYRDDRYGYGYGNNGRYGGNFAIIDRTLSDLRRAASRNRVDSHERGHFNRAMSELHALRSRGYSEGRLNRVIEDLRDLAQADQVHPSDRRILAQDLHQLRALRDGGYYRR